MLITHEYTRTPADVQVPRSVADWFENKVLDGRKRVFSEVVEVTPDLARLMLRGNEHNRNVNSSHVGRLAADIKDGKWDLNGESIKISPTGQLCDGQHRLHAVIQSNMPIRTVVTFGIDYETRLTTDQGKVKGIADYLSMSMDVKNAAIVSSAARILLAERQGLKDHGGNLITKTKIRGEYEKNRKDIDSAASFVVSNYAGRLFGGPSVLTAAMVILKRISPSADDFMQKLMKGNDLSDGDAILHARERFMRDPRMKMGDRIVLLRKAFDAWMEGREVRRIMVKTRIDAGRKAPKGKPGRQS